MTEKEKTCFQYGQEAAANGSLNDPECDHRMRHADGEDHAENMLAWRMGYLCQYISDGRMLDKDMFLQAMSAILPNTHEGAAQVWTEFISDIAEREQYVDFVVEPDQNTAKAHWYEVYLASFYQLRQKYGQTACEKTLELGLQDFCLYPYELNKGTKQLLQGCDFDKMVAMMLDGMLEDDVARFPKLRDLPEMGSLPQSPQINMDLK